MSLKLSQVKALRRKNVEYHNDINDAITKKSKFSLIKERAKHVRALREIPFFDKLLRKQIMVSAENKNYIVLGTGFKEQGTFRRSVVAIDDKGRAMFLARIKRITKEGSETYWLPYSMARKTRTEKGEVWSYAKIEPSTQREKREILALSKAVQSIAKHITFESIPPRKINQIKRFM